MNKEIAVIVNEKGICSDFFNGYEVRVYVKKDSFCFERSIRNFYRGKEQLAMLREDVKLLSEKLDGCKIIIGEKISGVVYHQLLSEQFIICEAAEVSETLFLQIEEDFMQIKTEENEVMLEEIRTKPEPCDSEGNYFLDFLKLQKYRPDITSKMALLSFLGNEIFQSLTIRCSHSMPWLELYAKERSMNLKVSRSQGITTVVLSHKQCERGSEYEI